MLGLSANADGPCFLTTLTVPKYQPCGLMSLQNQIDITFIHLLFICISAHLKSAYLRQYQNPL
jgi:hypothetical protein